MQSMSRSMSQSNDSNLRMSRRRHSRSCSNSPYSRDRTVSRRHSRSASNSWSGIQTHGTTSVGNMDIKPEPTSVPNVEIKSEPEEQSEISEQSNVRTDGDVWSTGWDCDALSSVQDKGPKRPKSKKFFDIFLPDAECTHKPELLPFQNVGEKADDVHTSGSSDELIPLLLCQSEIKKYCVLD